MNASSYQYPKKQAGAEGRLRDQACCRRFWCAVHHDDSRLAVAARKDGIGVESIREYY